MKKTFTTLVAAATIAGTLAMSGTDASAQRRGWGWGPGIALGVSAAPSSPAQSWLRGRRAMSSITAMIARSIAQAATGPASRSMIAAAASSAGKANRFRFAPEAGLA